MQSKQGGHCGKVCSWKSRTGFFEPGQFIDGQPGGGRDVDLGDIRCLPRFAEDVAQMIFQSHDTTLITSSRPHQCGSTRALGMVRSEEHTSELQSQSNLVCRLLLEKKKKKKKIKKK